MKVERPQAAKVKLPVPPRPKQKMPRVRGGSTNALSAELREYVAIALINDAGSPHRVSQPEWDAVYARRDWTHKEVAADLQLSYERVRYIRRMPRPTDQHVAPSYCDIALRAGCSTNQVYKVMADLIELRDGKTAHGPEDGYSFT